MRAITHKASQRGFLGAYVVSNLGVLHLFSCPYFISALHFYFLLYLEGIFCLLSRLFLYGTLVSQPQIKQIFNLRFLNYQQAGILFSFSPNDIKIPTKMAFFLPLSYQNLLSMVATASHHLLHPVCDCFTSIYWFE